MYVNKLFEIKKKQKNKPAQMTQISEVHIDVKIVS